MYARNNAAPIPVLVGTITQISDGAVQTSGVSVKISKDGGSWLTGTNAPAVEEGEWSYTPSQAETDCTSLRIVLYKTNCYSRSVQVVFTSSDQFGYVGTDQSKILNQNAIVNLANTSIKNSADNASQTSVDAIPTNPLLTTDTRLNNLDFPISSINTAIGNLNNLSALINLYGSPLLEIPDTGSTLYAFTIVVRDNEGKLVNLDTSPTITASNASGTNRSVNLSAVSNPATGRYTFTYSVASTHPQESLRIIGTGTVSAEARYIEWVGSVVNYDTLTTLLAVQTTVNNLDARIPAQPAAVGDIPTAAQNATATWSALVTTSWPNDSFGSKVVISTNNIREVAITGAHHIAADVHEFQPGSITEVDFADNALSARVLASDAVTEIVAGVWSRDLSSSDINTAGKNLFDTQAGVSTLLSRIIDGTAALITDLRTMIVGTGTSLVKWTVNALSNAPAGGGGGTIVATVAVPQLLEHTAFELDEVIVYRGCHWSFQIQNLGDLNGYTEIWFTLRKRQNDKDAESVLQISLTQGLLIANKSTSVTSSDGSLTVSEQNVTIQVKQSVTQFVEPSNNYDYDLKGRNAAGQTIMLHESDKFIVKRDVTRRVS